MEGPISIVEYFYEGDECSGHRCGYCKSTNKNVSQGWYRIKYRIIRFKCMYSIWENLDKLQLLN